MNHIDAIVRDTVSLTLANMPTCMRTAECQVKVRLWAFSYWWARLYGLPVTFN